MDIICTFCSTKLAIQDGKIPKNADFRVTCPRCQTKFRVSTKTDQARARGASGVLRSWFAPPSAAPPPPPEPEEPMEEFDSSAIKDEGLASSPEEDEFVEDRRLGVLRLAPPPQRATVQTARNELGHTVHIDLT